MTKIGLKDIKYSYSMTFIIVLLGYVLSPYIHAKTRSLIIEASNTCNLVGVLSDAFAVDGLLTFSPLASTFSAYEKIYTRGEEHIRGSHRSAF